MKIINIDGKDYKMNASAYTRFAYKNETGRSMLEDLQSLIDLKSKGNLQDIKILDEVSDLLLRLAFTMAKEADESQLTDYDSFLKGIANMYKDFKWAEEVITLASTPFLGQLQANK